jgi:hypothetical protein
MFEVAKISLKYSLCTNLHTPKGYKGIKNCCLWTDPWSHPLLYARISRNCQIVCQLGVLFPIPSLAFEEKHRVKKWKRVGGQEKVRLKSQE